jgi:hypothetical protein
MENKIVVTFPESQMLDNKDGLLENVELINSDEGIARYGGGAYLVNKEWYDKVKRGEVADREYTESELENGMTINWTYPIPTADEI